MHLHVHQLSVLLPEKSVQPEVFVYYDFGDANDDDDVIDSKMKKLQQ